MDKKVWYVTGASKGLGLALINRLLQAGHFVAATPALFPGLAAAVEPPVSLGSGNPRFLLLDADPADGPSMADTFQHIEETFGRIDVIVNNAGYGLGVPVNHSINVIQTALPWLKLQRSGHIINIAPITDVIGDTSHGRNFYEAARRATLDWSVMLTEEVRPLNVRVTTVLPEGFPIGSAGERPTPGSAQPAAQHSPGSAQHPSGSAQHPSGSSQFSPAPAQPWYCSIDGRQPGDPAKAAATLLRIAAAAEPPALVYLTSDAHKKATAKMDWLEEVIAGLFTQPSNSL